MSDWKDKRIAELENEVAELKALVKQLMAEIAVLKKGKTSKTSSLPPSHDMKRKNTNRTLRQKSGKKPGGQFGRKGTKLEMREQVDHVIEHVSEKCWNCGHHLEPIQGYTGQKGQILDILRINFKVTEHVQMVKTCPCFDSINKGKLPGTLDYCNVQYGEDIKSMIAYLSARQYIPVHRIQDLFLVMTGQKLSTGFIQNTIQRTADTLEVWRDKILEQIKASQVVHSDETGCRIGGKRQWFWIWTTELYSYIRASAGRGYKTITTCLGEGRFKFTLVSDRWAAQLKTKAKQHQICLVHLLRNCNELIESYGSKWAAKLKKVLQGIIELCRLSRIPKQKKLQIQQKLDALLSAPLSTSHTKIKTLQKQLCKCRESITTCLYQRKVPPHNNSSEQGIRNIKVKQKVSTHFRTMKGAQDYAIIRSIVDSAAKMGIHPLKAIQNPQLLFNSGE